MMSQSRHRWLDIRCDDEQLRRRSSDVGSTSSNGEVSIRIIDGGEQAHRGGFDESEEVLGQIHGGVTTARLDRDGADGGGTGSEVGDRGERVSMVASSSPLDAGNGDDGDGGVGGGNSNRDSSYQRYDVQQAAG
ncbi:RING-type E3 ubiquitin transferase [Sarracenia purpurea var. burkii]